MGYASGLPPECCEACGEPCRQVLVHTCADHFGTPHGPLLDGREHVAGDGMRHFWYQPHNCLVPQPDKCTICDPHALDDDPIMRRLHLSVGPRCACGSVERALLDVDA